MLFAAQRQRLYDPRIGFAAFPEFLEGEPIVVVFVHLIEYLIDPLLRRILVFRWLLTLKITNSLLDDCMLLGKLWRKLWNDIEKGFLGNRTCIYFDHYVRVITQLKSKINAFKSFFDDREIR